MNEELIDKKAVIDIVKNHIKSYVIHGYDILTGKIKALPTKEDDWVSVSERLPTLSDDYNVVLDLQDGMGGPVSGIMEFDSINQVWNYPGTDVVCDCVTAWQPLPSPPTK